MSITLNGWELIQVQQKQVYVIKIPFNIHVTASLFIVPLPSVGFEDLLYSSQVSYLTPLLHS